MNRYRRGWVINPNAIVLVAFATCLGAVLGDALIGLTVGLGLLVAGAFL